jgi:hypothetical protein
MKRVCLASLLALFGAVNSAQAAAIQLNVNVLLEGPAVSGDSTVATLLFEDVGTDQVRLTVRSSLNSAAEFISDIAFNVRASFVPSAVTASYIAGSQVGTFTLPTLASGDQNDQDPPGPGGNGPGNGFDYNYAFSVSMGDRFNLTDSFQYLFTATGLDVSDFNLANGAGHYAYAHVQGIASTTGTTSSGYVSTDPGVESVPEPTSLVLLGSGLVAVATRLRRKRA